MLYFFFTFYLTISALLNFSRSATSSAPEVHLYWPIGAFPVQPCNMYDLGVVEQENIPKCRVQ